MTPKMERQTSPPTVVIQSYKAKNIPRWIQICIESVRSWAESTGFTYQFFGDEIFDLLPDQYRRLVEGRMPILTDLCRLLLMRRALTGPHLRVIWVDADVLVFNSQNLNVPFDVGQAFSQEIWVQKDGNRSGRLRVYRNIHNAVCVFERGNVFLEFYIQSCIRIVCASQGRVPNHIVGTKFLTALHNIVQFPLIKSFGMFSPIVLRDIACGGGEALDRLIAETKAPLGAANLCLSLVGSRSDGVELSDEFMTLVCRRLKDCGLRGVLEVG